MTTRKTISLHNAEQAIKLVWPHRHESVVSRHGLTLMEILASVFILAFGLVAVISVLPLAVTQTERMNIADMGSACGRGAIQQVRMAEWQKPENIWVGTTQSNENIEILNFYGALTSTEWCQIADPFIVDPLGLGDPTKTGSSLSTEPSVYQYVSGGSSVMGRKFPIPVNAYNNDSLHVMSICDPVSMALIPQNMVSQSFYWGDDTIFAPGDTERPAIVPRSSDGNPSAAGQFTWLYMVTPIVAGNNQNIRRHSTVFSQSGSVGYSPFDSVTGYEVATVVFHRRDLYPEPLVLTQNENQYRPIRRLSLGACTINAVGAYVELKSTYAEDLDLSSIKWVLLTGRSQELQDSVLSGDNPLIGSLVAQWYRVTGSDDIRAGEIEPGVDGYLRRVFLVGPDWKGAKDTSGNPDGDVHAILCDGVVNVFQTTMPK